MSKLFLYSVFHANLNFSYIPEDLYPQIIRRCYRPLLRIAEELDVPLGLEFSGYTLETINRLDPSFVKDLRRLWHKGGCEVIGSGYAQAIMPLIPARVNRENLRQGNGVYQALLGKQPSVAYVNEQVFSAGLPQLYKDAGYQTLMVNWDSSLPAHVNKENFYRPCSIPCGDGGRLPVIWHSTEVYRDFQQYVENEIQLDDYLSRLFSHLPETGERALPLYSSDWEVFDFKPWRIFPEGFHQPDWGEMERISGLFSLLKERHDIELVTPSAVVSRFADCPEVPIESASYPLTYKKQIDHSVTRWAVGGRDNVRFNTQCHQLYQGLLLVEWGLRNRGDSEALQEECDNLWKELTFLWSSDFRTFTTEDKHTEFRNRMGSALTRLKGLEATIHPLGVAADEIWLANRSSVPAESEPVSFVASANGASTTDLPAYGLQIAGQLVPCQVTERVSVGYDNSRLTLEASPRLAAGSIESGTIQLLTGSSGGEGRDYEIDSVHHIVQTDHVRLCLLPESGCAIESLEFPQVATGPLIWSRGNDLEGISVSGDLVLEDWLSRKTNDHQPVQVQFPEPGQRYAIFVPVRCSVTTELGTIWKTYRVYLHQPRVDLVYRFQWRDVVPKSFRLGRMILNPNAFDQTSLFYATTNGGENVEHFPLQGQYVAHDEPTGEGSTAQTCLGATEGWVVIGDDAKGVGFVTRPAGLYSVPLVHYEELKTGGSAFLLSLSHSLGELDETSHTLWRGHSTWSLAILGGDQEIITKTRASALLANGGLLAWSADGAHH